MLETSQERVKLLKACVPEKDIEKLYITYNDFKVVLYPMFFEIVEINTKGHENIAISQEKANECYG